MERSDRWLSVALRAALLVLFFWIVKGLLVPVVLGAIFALLLHPIERRLVPKLGRFRRFAPGMLTIGAIVVFVIPLVLIAIQAVSSFNELLARDWSATFDHIQGFLDSRMAGISGLLGISTARVRGYLTDAAGRVGSWAAGLAGGLAAQLPHIIVILFIFAVALFFFLRDGGALARWMLRLSPFKPDETTELFTSIRETVRGAVLGLLATSLVQGTLTTLALAIFKVPGALLFGVIATILSMVPLVGTTPVTIGAAIYLFVVGRIGAGIGMIVAAVLIGLSDNIVRPWVQSTQGRMHPLVALLSIFGGLEVLGFAGIFIGPVIAVMALWSVDTYAALHLGRGQPPGDAGRPPQAPQAHEPAAAEKPPPAG
jgi:predicted PurR-regulated permease PerM